MVALPACFQLQHTFYVNPTQFRHQFGLGRTSRSLQCCTPKRPFKGSGPRAAFQRPSLGRRAPKSPDRLQQHVLAPPPQQQRHRTSVGFPGPPPSARSRAGAQASRETPARLVRGLDACYQATCPHTTYSEGHPTTPSPTKAGAMATTRVVPPTPAVAQEPSPGAAATPMLLPTPVPARSRRPRRRRSTTPPPRVVPTPTSTPGPSTAAPRLPAAPSPPHATLASYFATQLRRARR